jgi:hypothetical protein
LSEACKPKAEASSSRSDPIRALIGKPLSKNESEVLITTAVDVFVRGTA